VWFITKLFRTRGSYRAVAVTAVAYPLRARFRTGLSIFIFGLVIFTVTVLSMISSMIGAGVTTMVEETSGGFDLVAVKSLPSPMPDNPWEYINSSQPQLLQPENVTNMIWLPAMPVTANYTGITSNGGSTQAERSTSVIGINQRFYTEGNFPLTQWNSSQYPSQNAVYQAVMDDPSLIIVDGGWVPSSMEFGPGLGAGTAGREVGTTVRLQSIFGTFQNVTVAGIMKQQFFNGVFMNESLVASDYGAVGPSVMFMNFAEGLDVAEQAALLEQVFLPWGVQTINVKELAEMVTSAIDNVFVLFRAFLAIGLVIGIVGLGIITIRSINERKLEIGMMRAIGFRKRMVVVNFAIESGFVSAIGIIIGTVMGIIIGYTIWQSNFMGDYEFPFVIPWWPILLVAFAAFVATVLCVYPAARGASKVSPAEVLRFD
jgi:putative ABC transport system permease protein